MKLHMLTCLLLASTSIAEEAGRIEVVGNDSIDFGRYPAWEKKVAVYQIKYSGKGKLEILNIRKTCGCASAVCDKKVLRANETANVEVVILPNSIFGLYSKNTFVESNDPATKFLRLTVAGNSIPLIEVSPALEINAGRIKANASWTQSFDLKATEPGVVLGDVKTESNYKVENKLQKLAGRDGHYALSVNLVPSAESGDFRCTMSMPVTTPTNHPPIRILVTGRIGTELSAVPGIAYLSLSGDPQTRVFSLRVLGERTKVLRPEELSLPVHKDAAFGVKPVAQCHGLEVTATFGPEFAKELYAEETIPLEFKIRGTSSATVVCMIRK
ncbi:MAG: DUF1573 domain-containing protein [bacterium]